MKTEIQVPKNRRYVAETTQFVLMIVCAVLLVLGAGVAVWTLSNVIFSLAGFDSNGVFALSAGIATSVTAAFRFARSL